MWMKLYVLFSFKDTKKEYWFEMKSKLCRILVVNLNSSQPLKKLEKLTHLCKWPLFISCVYRSKYCFSITMEVSEHAWNSILPTYPACLILHIVISRTLCNFHNANQYSSLNVFCEIEFRYYTTVRSDTHK